MALKLASCQLLLRQAAPNGYVNRAAPEMLGVIEASVGAAPVERVLGVAWYYPKTLIGAHLLPLTVLLGFVYNFKFFLQGVQPII